MCKCTPHIRTPFCGKGDCVWPPKDLTDKEFVEKLKQNASKEYPNPNIIARYGDETMYLMLYKDYNRLLRLADQAVRYEEAMIAALEVTQQIKAYSMSAKFDTNTVKANEIEFHKATRNAYSELAEAEEEWAKRCLAAHWLSENDICACELEMQAGNPLHKTLKHNGKKIGEFDIIINLTGLTLKGTILK